LYEWPRPQGGLWNQFWKLTLSNLFIILKLQSVLMTCNRLAYDNVNGERAVVHHQRRWCLQTRSLPGIPVDTIARLSAVMRRSMSKGTICFDMLRLVCGTNSLLHFVNLIPLSCYVDSLLLSSITPSLFHSRLKTYIFHESFPTYRLSASFRTDYTDYSRIPFFLSYIVFMVALCNRADHYNFHPVVCSIFLLLLLFIA